MEFLGRKQAANGTWARLRVVGILRVRIFVNIMQIRERNEEGMGRGSKKTDYGGFIVLQIPVPEKREILIG